MKLFAILSLLFCTLLIDTTSADSCSNEFNCNEIRGTVWTSRPAEGCSAAYAGFPDLQTKSQNLAEQHLEASMKYLLFASHFGTWNYDRKGFAEYFGKLSDEAFEDAVSIIKHMSKRGGRLEDLTVTMVPSEHEVSELEGLTKALDIQRALANETSQVIHSAGHGSHEHNRFPDGEFAHFLAEEILEKATDRVQNLATHVNNLGDAIAATTGQLQDTREDLTKRAFLIHLYDTQFLN
jgi:ferritin